MYVGYQRSFGFILLVTWVAMNATHLLYNYRIIDEKIKQKYSGDHNQEFQWLQK